MTANGGTAVRVEAWSPRHLGEGIPPPGPAEVQVWRIPVARPPQPPAALDRLLTPGERARAAGIRAAGARARFLVARGSLRLLLGGMLGVPPREVPLAVGPHGKPAIDGAGRESGLRFNVAHSGDLVLVAAAVGREVGVDVERVRDRTDCAAIAARFLGARVAARIDEPPPAGRRREFFRLWCRAEALLKARGTGWAGARGMIDADPELAGAAFGEVVDLAPGPGYAGAVAATGAGWRLACFDLGVPGEHRVARLRSGDPG